MSQYASLTVAQLKDALKEKNLPTDGKKAEAEKFGDEALATAAKKDLARVEKFGVDPSTALGKEIGDLSKDVNSELGNGKFKKGKKRNGRGKKVAKN
ncbi:hypothetical protein HF325_006617 [Metschnikowia pulcherrima]|uniref:SAP domain-containing protein n=1 Tax=Metschnikowia pulcherrima TaxID=27326 RepID=A0A8H7L996_9ASCO|nr:hypothetical protein HF325_006617 [Metschnikowia pulcherrima]